MKFRAAIAVYRPGLIDRICPFYEHNNSRHDGDVTGCRTRNSIADFAAPLRDQARGALIAGVDPEAADRDAQGVAQADQEVDVRDAPYPPGQRAAQLDRSEIDHRLALADLRQA